VPSTSYATEAALSAQDTTIWVDFSLATTQDQQRFWMLSKASVATLTTDVIAAAPAGRWLAIPLRLFPQNTVYVAKNGIDATGQRNNPQRPFLTLQAAVNAASSGDLISIAPGTWVEQVTMPNVDNLTVAGSGMWATKVSGDPAVAEAAILVNGSAVRKITFRDLTIEKTYTLDTTVPCIRFLNPVIDANFLIDGAILTNVRAERNSPGGAGAGQYDCFYFDTVNKAILRNCQGGIRFFNCGETEVWNCKVKGVGDVFSNLIISWINPAAAVIPGGQQRNLVMNCDISGSTANSVAGVELRGGAPWVEFMACNVKDGMTAPGNLTRYTVPATVVPKVYFRDGSIDGNLSITYAGSGGAGTFDFAGTVQTSGTNTWNSTATRQAVSWANAVINTITPQNRIDLDIRNAKYTSFTATIGANGATVDRTTQSFTATMDGAGAGSVTGIFPWPTGKTLFIVSGHRATVTPGPTCANINAAIVGPQAALGSLTVGGPAAGVVNIIISQ
jgi:hypothetical protein